MIEDELRALLTERADGIGDNPARTAEVRSRITGIRRRRIAGTALGLVLVALAGLAVLRLPGTDKSLPPGVPAPPWFDDLGRPVVPGYEFRTPWEIDGPQQDLLVLPIRDGFPALIVVRCERPGSVVVRNLAGPRFEVDCSRRVGDGFEGVTALTPEQAVALPEAGPPALYPSGANVAVEPGSPGRWLVTVLVARAPDRLPRDGTPPEALLVDGPRTPDGATARIRVPPARMPEPGVPYDTAMSFTTDCVAGVQLVLTVPTGELGRADCDPLGPEMHAGKVAVAVSKRQLAALGLRPGDFVDVTVRSVGRDTDQWRVFLPLN